MPITAAGTAALHVTIAELPESQSGEAAPWQLAIAGPFGREKKAKFAASIREANRTYGTYQPEDEEVMQAG